MLRLFFISLNKKSPLGAYCYYLKKEVFIMRLNCGDICPKTGSYKVVDKNGNVVNKVYVGEGETMPPTQTENCHYESER